MISASAFDQVVVVCDDPDAWIAIRSTYASYAGCIQLLVPSIALPAAVQALPDFAVSLNNLVLPQHLLEGPLPTQDSQQLLLHVQALAKSGEKIHVVLAAAGGIGYYLLQSRAVGLLSGKISIERSVHKSCGELMEASGCFPTEIDHLVALFQERKEIELSRIVPEPIVQKAASITACITHYNRPWFLRASLNSLLEQTCLPQEIIIADDGSDLPEAQALLEAIEKEQHVVPVRILHLQHGFPDAARNAAWRSSATDFVFFMDDDDRAMPEELACLFQAAVAAKADIVTCQMCYFAEDAERSDIMRAARWLPLGNAVEVGFYANLFGPQNALVRRTVLEKQGGFGEGGGTGHEDWEFYGRACLAGAKLELVPQPLFWCRRRPGVSWMYTTNKYLDFGRNLQPYLDAVPPAIKDILRLAFGRVVAGEGHVGPMWQRRHERIRFWPKD